ncbi:MAG: AlpA family transcriptional regulator [Paracoccus sp.]|nr:MAG: AlpA family transcriptional regulator [Paracoccus sp. (in: a-proteobacteria)]
MGDAPNNTASFLTVEQVAARYGVSTDTIWRWKRVGEFPKAVKVGPGATRWRVSDLLEFEATLQACFATDANFLVQAMIRTERDRLK